MIHLHTAAQKTAGKSFGRLLAGLLCVCLLSVSGFAAGAAVGTLEQPLNNYTGRTQDEISLSVSNETPVGLAAADALRFASGADVAILCGGSIDQGIDPGPVTHEMAAGAFHEEERLVIAQITPAQLRALLEFDLSGITVGENEYIDREASAFPAYPQIAGFVLRYDPTAPAGERVMSIAMEAGELDLADEESLLTLCVTENQLNGAYGYTAPWPWEASEMTDVEAMEAYIATGIETAYGRENRTREYGVNDNSLFSYVPRGLVLLLILIALLANGAKFRKQVEPSR